MGTEEVSSIFYGETKLGMETLVFLEGCFHSFPHSLPTVWWCERMILTLTGVKIIKAQSGPIRYVSGNWYSTLIKIDWNPLHFLFYMAIWCHQCIQNPSRTEQVSESLFSWALGQRERVDIGYEGIHLRNKRLLVTVCVEILTTWDIETGKETDA